MEMCVQVLLSCCGYMMICFMFNMLDELFPIFAAAPIATGGAALTPLQCCSRQMTGLGHQVERPRLASVYARIPRIQPHPIWGWRKINQQSL